MKKEKLEEGVGGGAEEEYHSGELWVERGQKSRQISREPQHLAKDSSLKHRIPRNKPSKK